MYFHSVSDRRAVVHICEFLFQFLCSRQEILSFVQMANVPVFVKAKQKIVRTRILQMEITSY